MPKTPHSTLLLAKKRREICTTFVFLFLIARRPSLLNAFNGKQNETGAWYEIFQAYFGKPPSSTEDPQWDILFHTKQVLAARRKLFLLLNRWGWTYSANYR